MPTTSNKGQEVNDFDYETKQLIKQYKSTINIGAIEIKILSTLDECSYHDALAAIGSVKATIERRMNQLASEIIMPVTDLINNTSSNIETCSARLAAVLTS